MRGWELLWEDQRDILQKFVSVPSGSRRALAAMANETPSSGAPAESVSAGTHLVREWNGRTYQVEVIDNGYRFDGKTYPSLTTIAKRITGCAFYLFIRAPQT